MEIAILILIIVSVILLSIVTFFSFQIWVQTKEAKLQLANHHQDIQKGFSNADNNMTALNLQLANHHQEILKGFSNSDNNLKTLNLQLIDSIGIEYKGLVNSILQLKEEVGELGNEIKDVKSEILKNMDSYSQKSEGKISDGLESVKIKTNSTIEGLSDSVKIFKDNIDSRIKELDSTISEKLVNDLTHLTSVYTKSIKEEQSKVLDKFEQTSKEINKKQSEILKAITEPLKINLNNND
ncbi:MAG: hypothetical protein RL516_1299 [Bacteroidota bacterium]|jgi:hypothetical protein